MGLRGAEIRFLDGGRSVINFGLALVVILLIIALIASIYEIVSGNRAAANFIRNPEIVALAIGLILTVLFVDRWRALESKIDGMSKDQRDRLEEIQTFSKEQIELKVDQAISKAEKVSAKLSSLSEAHPWLQVISDRDILVETESVRGILRSSYMLLRDDRPLHLYEFLEYCSRKGTSEDPRTSKLRLRGSVDDFLEAASFCETWLEDHALGAQFLRRFIEQNDASSYVAYPDYARRMLRMGDLQTAKRYADRIERILARDVWRRRLPMLRNRTPVSARYWWHAVNILSLTYASFGDSRMARRFAVSAASSTYATVFHVQQRLLDAERLAYLGDVVAAARRLDGIDLETLTTFDLKDLLVLQDRLGLATSLPRSVLEKRQADMLSGKGASGPHVSPPATSRRPARKPPAMKLAKAASKDRNLSAEARNAALDPMDQDLAAARTDGRS